MKLSIIVGVTHMTLGILIKGWNCLHFREYLSFVFDFIPQIIFMLLLFGYMCFAIIVKWLQDWTGRTDKAPSIISLFINMGITDSNNVLFGDRNGTLQTHVQQLFFLIAFICIFVMLLPKPIIQYMQFKRKHKKKRVHSSLKEVLVGESEEDVDHSSEAHDPSQIFVHQLIEVIEFVLGSVSNTASYLRLWALSLAHGQLARVFLNMTILDQIKAGSPIVAVVGFPIFVAATVGVLMLMDLMECFLHTLRLHWVEF